jgi:hypothetical protein
MTAERIEIVGFREPHTNQKLVPVKYADMSQGGCGEWASRVSRFRGSAK